MSSGAWPPCFGDMTAPARSRRRVPAIDGLRGVAILSVVLFHSFLSTRTLGVRTIDRVFEIGLGIVQPVAIDLFFTMSGYLITSILDGTRDADHPLRTFYVRRALRIVPLYYAFLLGVVIFLPSLPSTIIGAPGSIVWQFGFMTNIALDLGGNRAVGALFPHFWTLAVEEQFYLLWPLLILFQPARRNLKACLVVLALSLVTRTVMAFGSSFHLFLLPFDHKDSILSILVFTPAHLDGLAIGAIAALLERQNPELLKKMARKSIPVAIAGMVVTILIVVSPPSRDALAPAAWVSAMPFFSSVFFAGIIALTAMGETATPRWMTWPPLTSVARYSYGMYAFHIPLITLLFYFHFVRQQVAIRGYDIPYRMFFFVVIASISYGLGFLSWHLYEKHFLKLAPRYRYSAVSETANPRPIAVAEPQLGVHV
jgi:peptidoglycan/LPS O-acetylase OafA/YrhL